MSNTNTFYFHHQKVIDAMRLASLRTRYDKHGLDQLQYDKQDGKCFKCSNAIPDLDEAFYQPVRVTTLRREEKVAGVILCPTCYMENKAMATQGNAQERHRATLSLNRSKPLPKP